MAGFSQTASLLVFPLKSRITPNTLRGLPRDNYLKRTLHSFPRLRIVNPLAVSLIRWPDTVFCYTVLRSRGVGGWSGKLLVVALVICLFWRSDLFPLVLFSQVFAGLFCPSGVGGRGGCVYYTALGPEHPAPIRRKRTSNTFPCGSARLLEATRMRRLHGEGRSFLKERAEALPEHFKYRSRC